MNSQLEEKLIQIVKMLYGSGVKDMNHALDIIHVAGELVAKAVEISAASVYPPDYVIDLLIHTSDRMLRSSQEKPVVDVTARTPVYLLKEFNK